MSNEKNDLIKQHLQEQEFLRQQIIVTEVDYSHSVKSLVKLAQGDTSGSRAAAQLLLSLYNGHNWHVDLTDLCLLDHRYLLDAIIAIRGRVTLFKEPHDVIDNGSDVFRELEEQWQHLHVRNRYRDARKGG